MKISDLSCCKLMGNQTHSNVREIISSFYGVALEDNIASLCVHHKNWQRHMQLPDAYCDLRLLWRKFTLVCDYSFL